ncbi:MAG: alanine--tRNA ligase, partial [Saprospiraceae bacterium]
FERLSMVLQKKKSSYDTDIFSPLINYISSFSRIEYKGSYDPKAKSDMAMRVLADHIRAITFTIADGTLPSNTGSGYVIRRILRRAVRYYYSFLQIKEPFLYRLVPILVQTMGDFFPELISQNEFVVKVIKEEELSFLRTLEEGLKKLESLVVENNIISGNISFELYDTYGFPLDLTMLIASEKNWTVDEEKFKELLNEQKTRSRADAKKSYSDWNFVREGSTHFVGYDVEEVEKTKLLRWRQIESKGEIKYQLVLETTPFYPEGGGQVGDRGLLYFNGLPIEVIDTVKENDLILHIVEVLPIDLNVDVRAVINGFRRSLIEKNHSSTHLLHSALRRVLGNHVQQKGSLVNNDYLRFDFSHFQKLSSDELRNIEKMVNEKIRENIQLQEYRNLPIEEAKNSGAMMLFGEKYSDHVRMICFDSNYSKELCGGCHVSQTGSIGYFKIISESAVGAGVRRIEAVSAGKAEEYLEQHLGELHQLKQILNSPMDSIGQLKSILDENKILQKEIQELKEEKAMNLKSDLIKEVEILNNVSILCKILPIEDGKTMKNLIYSIGKELKSSIIIFGYIEKFKPNLMVYVSEELVSTKNINASHLIRLISKHIDGGGGGQAFFATAGGKKVEGLNDALSAAKSYINQNLNS